jgi:hypothetical protein
MLINYSDKDSGVRVIITSQGFNFYFQDNLVAKCHYGMSKEGLKSLAEEILKELSHEQQ